MSSIAQIHANRQNSQKSTGPRSAKGKAVVAKNAVKHGLFAQEAVITGENEKDYDLFREEILAELAPAGAMESILAERFVSLSWRLQRIERIQNLVIDSMIERELTSPLANLTEQFLPKSLRKPKSETNSTRSSSEMTLGKIVSRDCANSRVLERLLMYERRIENSLFKTTKELDRRKIMRQLGMTETADEPAEYEGTDHPQATLEAATRSSPSRRDKAATRSPKDEAATPQQCQKNAKQSQLSAAKNDINAFVKVCYENNSYPDLQENKANSKPIKANYLAPGPVPGGMPGVEKT